MKGSKFVNPFRPGAGHKPPHLAGRQAEIQEFRRLLQQDVILENLVLTGLRGTGKTVLLEALKPEAVAANWFWVGADLSESASLSEDRLATRLMVDLAVMTSPLEITIGSVSGLGFRPEKKLVNRNLDFDTMRWLFDRTPGLASDKLKAVLQFVWACLRDADTRGVVFAYDEAQNLSDKHAEKGQYPLSLMLDVFQSIQRQGIPFMLALSGLPTLFPSLVEARTFAERMFHVVTLDRLGEEDSREAILTPVKASGCPIQLWKTEVARIIEISGGYPYFIQFVGREVFDIAIPQHERGKRRIIIPFDTIVQKLDTDFFSGRWARATDRQRELL
jgi:hypothetical protein